MSRNQKNLRVVNACDYGTDCSALLDSGVVPNIISHALAEKLSLAPTETNRRIRVADVSITPCLGFLSDVARTFDDLTVYADFLVIRGPPFDVIVGIDLLKAVNASLDFSWQMVRVSQNRMKARIPLLTECIRMLTEDTEDTDSEDFTSDSDAAIDYDGDDSFSEEEFLLTIASPQPYKPDSAMSVPQDSSHEDLEEKNDDVDFIDLPDLKDIDAAYPTSSEEDLELAEEDLDESNDPEYDPEHTNISFYSNSSSSDEDINLSLPAAMATPSSVFPDTNIHIRFLKLHNEVALRGLHSSNECAWRCTFLFNSIERMFMNVSHCHTTPKHECVCMCTFKCNPVEGMYMNVLSSYVTPQNECTRM